LILPDDPEIADADILWRRLRPDWIRESDEEGVFISSAAFWQDGELGEVSVNVARLTSLEAVLAAGRESDSLGSTEAGFPRSLGFAVALFEEEGNPGHAHLYPPRGWKKNDRRRSGREMARHARIVVQRTAPIKA
jgi:hypothetical protein